MGDIHAHYNYFTLSLNQTLRDYELTFRKSRKLSQRVFFNVSSGIYVCVYAGSVPRWASSCGVVLIGWTQAPRRQRHGKFRIICFQLLFFGKDVQCCLAQTIVVVIFIVCVVVQWLPWRGEDISVEISGTEHQMSIVSAHAHSHGGRKFRQIFWSVFGGRLHLFLRIELILSQRVGFILSLC